MGVKMGVKKHNIDSLSHNLVAGNNAGSNLVAQAKKLSCVI